MNLSSINSLFITRTFLLKLSCKPNPFPVFVQKKKKKKTKSLRSANDFSRFFRFYPHPILAIPGLESSTNHPSPRPHSSLYYPSFLTMNSTVLPASLHLRVQGRRTLSPQQASDIIASFLSSELADAKSNQTTSDLLKRLVAGLKEEEVKREQESNLENGKEVKVDGAEGQKKKRRKSDKGGEEEKEDSKKRRKVESGGS